MDDSNYLVFHFKECSHLSRQLKAIVPADCSFLLGAPFFSLLKIVFISPLDTNNTVSFDGNVHCLYKSLLAVTARRVIYQGGL